MEKKLTILTLLLILLGTIGASGSGVRMIGSRISTGTPAPPPTGACTDGSTCYCDTAAGYLVCEDFENINFYQDTSTDFAAGQAGDGGLHDRGALSAWTTLHESGSLSTSSSWRFSVAPTSPYIGSRCQFGSGAPSPGNLYTSCSGIIEYCSAAQGALTAAGVSDCWGPGANAIANLDIQRAGDFDEEIPTLTLSGGTGAAADVGAGNQHMAYRVFTSGNETGVGRRTFTSSSEIGVTMLHAYSSNVLSTGILNQPWKHEEWFNSSNGQGYGEHWHLGMTGATNNLAYFPFQPFMWGSSPSACATAIASATAHVGAVHCTPNGLGFTANGTDAYPNFETVNGTAYRNSGVTNYNRTTDWPDLATWQCTRAHVTGMNGTMELKVWHNNTLVIHFSGLSTAGWKVNTSYNRMWWNAYSNEQNLNGISATTYRYRDNVDIRNTAPVSCAAVGLP